MGATGSKGGSSGSKSAPQTPIRDAASEEPRPASSAAVSSADIHKKGIAALIRPLKPPGLHIRPGQSLSEVLTPQFNVMSLANNLSQRFSVLSGLSFISLVSAPPSADGSRKKITRTRYRGGSISGPGKTAWPVAQTELLFLPEFPVGTDQKMQLIFYGEVSRGAFGQVFHVQCGNTMLHYAMKVLAKSQVCSLDVVNQVKQEVMIQQMCSHHPFVCPLTHHWQTRKLLVVMTEYVAYGELHQLWQSLGTLPDNLVALYVAEIAVTIDFLHNAGIIYRDLKMENLLLDEDGHIKLIDFGLAKWLRYGNKTGSICGTLHLMAPEVCSGSWYGHSVDWWSLGIIAYCLVVGRYPVPLQLNHTSMMHAIAKWVPSYEAHAFMCDYQLPEDTDLLLVSLIKGLLNRDPNERIHSLVQLQKEPLFTDTDLSTITQKKVAPRKLLEDYIEKKTRQNFEDFAGLTSTPKRCQKSTEAFPCSNGDHLSKQFSSPGIDRAGVSSPAFQRGSKTPLGFHKRSASSPLLHPGRLGHHDSVLKCGGAVGPTNGAAVPILQSPLLRLARQHCINQASARYSRAPKPVTRPHSHSYVNITALSSSPSLLHSQRVRERKQRFRGSKKQPSLPTLHQEKSTFDSMRMSSSINEIPSCLEGSSSSTSCEKLFSSHSYHTNESDTSSSLKREFYSRPLSADLSSRGAFGTVRNFGWGGVGKSPSPPVASSPVHGRGGFSVPFINTLPPIASSPLPPSSPNPPSSPLPRSSPAPTDQPLYGSSLLPPEQHSLRAFLSSSSPSSSFSSFLPVPSLRVEGVHPSPGSDTSSSGAAVSQDVIACADPTANDSANMRSNIEKDTQPSIPACNIYFELTQTPPTHSSPIFFNEVHKANPPDFQDTDCPQPCTINNSRNSIISGEITGVSLNSDTNFSGACAGARVNISSSTPKVRKSNIESHLVTTAISTGVGTSSSRLGSISVVDNASVSILSAGVRESLSSGTNVIKTCSAASSDSTSCDCPYPKTSQGDYLSVSSFNTSLCDSSSSGASVVTHMKNVSRSVAPLCSQTSGILTAGTINDVSVQTIVPSALLKISSTDVHSVPRSSWALSTTSGNFITSESATATAKVTECRRSLHSSAASNAWEKPEALKMGHNRSASLSLPSSGVTRGPVSLVPASSSHADPSPCLPSHCRSASFSSPRNNCNESSVRINHNDRGSAANSILASFGSPSSSRWTPSSPRSSIGCGEGPASGTSEVHKFAFKEKLASFQKNRDRISAFQRDLLPHVPRASGSASSLCSESGELSVKNTNASESYSPMASKNQLSSQLVSNLETSPSAAPERVCSSSRALYKPPVLVVNSEVVNYSKIRTSPLTYCRTKITSLSSASSTFSSPQSSPKLTRTSSIRTSPHFRYKQSARNCSALPPSDVPFGSTTNSLSYSIQPKEEQHCDKKQEEDNFVCLSESLESTRSTVTYPKLSASRSSPSTLVTSGTGSDGGFPRTSPTSSNLLLPSKGLSISSCKSAQNLSNRVQTLGVSRGVCSVGKPMSSDTNSGCPAISCTHHLNNTSDSYLLSSIETSSSGESKASDALHNANINVLNEMYLGELALLSCNSGYSPQNQQQQQSEFHALVEGPAFPATDFGHERL
ncbi:Protein kinase domain [Trinorchestia longiramus]|nr:Protein kinase domain [Trinorchestia longiramus]